MGIELVTAILNDAATILQDVGHTRWPSIELLRWLNLAQQTIALNKPTATSRRATVPLVAGVVQKLPADGIILMSVVRNMPGRAITLAQQSVLDSQLPDWYSMAGVQTVQHYCFDGDDQKSFLVYPPNTGSGRAEIIYSGYPTQATMDGTITLDDIYAPVILDLILYRAYDKDTIGAVDPARSAAHFQAAMLALGVKSKIEAMDSPNLTGVKNAR